VFAQAGHPDNDFLQYQITIKLKINMQISAKRLYIDFLIPKEFHSIETTIAYDPVINYNNIRVYKVRL
jgi:hypothetical protein